MGRSTILVTFRYSVIHPTHSSTFGCKRRFGVIGYNVIEEVIKGPYQWEKTAQRPLERLWVQLSVKWSENATALVNNLVQSAGVKRVKERQEQLNSATWTKDCSSLARGLGSPWRKNTSTVWTSSRVSLASWTGTVWVTIFVVWRITSRSEHSSP